MLTSFFTVKQIEILKKRKILSIKELLFYFPTKYIDRSQELNPRNIQYDSIVSFIAKPIKTNIIYSKRKFCVSMVDYQGFSIQLSFFHNIYYYYKLLSNSNYLAFSGKISNFKGKISIMHPEIEEITKEDLKHTNKIIPIYKITDLMKHGNITSRKLRNVIYTVLQKYQDNILDHLDEKNRNQYDLLPLYNALSELHFPKNMRSLSKAKERLAFDEFLTFFTLMKIYEEEKSKILKEYLPANNSKYQDAVLKSLPFCLTEEQIKVLQFIKDSSIQQKTFSILLQGDVGSGKTIVALLAALPYMEMGIQVALLAPTEVLVRQHYTNILDILHVIPLIQIEFLLGKESVKEKRIKIDRIHRGITQLVIGTHALLQKEVVFHRLGFVIIDEQHRFGVEQRTRLIKKGVVDLLAMTATPIPRSLSLTLFGDLEPVYIKQKPTGRLSIETKIFPESDLPRIYKGVMKYVNQGFQVYIIYSLIGDEEKNTNEGVNSSLLFEEEKVSVANIYDEYETLKNDIFKGYSVGLVHGKLNIHEKNQVMERFKKNEIKILVSTTVVEVGIDVANANVMVIRNAERFGLSQLHQLRGRVGRSNQQSFCILVYGSQVTPEGEKRLQIMLESDDGFYLAEKDLELRGAGELLGLKQAGASEFMIADLRVHRLVAENAKELIKNDMKLYNWIREKKGWKNKIPENKNFLLYNFS